MLPGVPRARITRKLGFASRFQLQRLRATLKFSFRVNGNWELADGKGDILEESRTMGHVKNLGESCQYRTGHLNPTSSISQ